MRVIVIMKRDVDDDDVVHTGMRLLLTFFFLLGKEDAVRGAVRDICN